MTRAIVSTRDAAWQEAQAETTDATPTISRTGRTDQT